LDLSLPRGIRDIEPEEYARHEEVRRRFAEVASLFNFKMMEPAPLEHLSTLRAKSGEDIDKEVYYFKDKGGREIGLRFDLTVGMTRYVCSRKDLKPPIKLAGVGGAWRYDEPQHARFRWFNQWDLEIFGTPSVAADAEVIDASHKIFGALGVKGAVTQVGDRRVVEEFISKQMRASGEEAVELMRALDKSQKKSFAELEAEYAKKGIGSEKLKSLFEFGNTRGAPERVISDLNELGLDSVGELEALRDMLQERGVKDVEYNLSIVRGIDYYTGLVFEVVDPQHRDLGSLCGGGRFDALPKLFGRPDLSATGAAGGLEREALSLPGGEERKVLVYVASAGEATYLVAMRYLSALRSEGLRADSSLQRRPLGKQLEQASALGARWLIIVGEKELAAGLVTLKDMSERSERRVSLEEAVQAIKAGS